MQIWSQNSTVLKTVVNSILVSSIILVMSACMANMTESVGVNSTNTAKQDEKFILGDYNASAFLAAENKDIEAALDEANLLSTLRAGNSYLYAQNYKKSKSMLDEAEAIIKYHHEEALAGSVADYTAQLLLNDAAIDFHSTITDAIMVNTYKAVTHMANHKFDDARVELNRAIDRQRRAKETYAELIGKQKEAIDSEKQKRKKSGKDSSSGFDKTLTNPDIMAQVNQNYSNLSQFEAYPDFVNPFSTYLAGLFFAIQGDYSKSVDLMKEVKGMMPKNKTVASDFAMINKAASGRPLKGNYVWVVFENGLAPLKTEYRIEIPLFLATNKLTYTGIALPKMQVRQDEFNSGLSVFNNNKKIASTEIVADMDRVILTEFNYGYSDVVTRAVFSTILKTYIQYESKKTNEHFGLIMSAFHLITTHADTRTWSTLPKNFHVARVEIPQDYKLKLKAGAQNISVDIDKDAKHAIVYVRIPTAISQPSVSVINF